MSRDFFAFIKENVEDVEHPWEEQEWMEEPIGVRSELKQRITEHRPDIEWADDGNGWRGVFTDDPNTDKVEYSVEVELGDYEVDDPDMELEVIQFIVGGDDVEKPMLKLADQCGWRLWDESIQEWVE